MQQSTGTHDSRYRGYRMMLAVETEYYELSAVCLVMMSCYVSFSCTVLTCGVKSRHKMTYTHTHTHTTLPRIQHTHTHSLSHTLQHNLSNVWIFAGEALTNLMWAKVTSITDIKVSHSFSVSLFLSLWLCASFWRPSVRLHIWFFNSQPLSHSLTQPISQCTILFLSHSVTQSLSQSIFNDLMSWWMRHQASGNWMWAAKMEGEGAKVRYTQYSAA